MKSYNFPPLYAAWMNQLLPGPVPDETRATCMDCPICKQPEVAGTQDRAFNPSTKCCTFIPVLPNFLVGAILQDEDPAFAEGKALFEIEAPGLSVTPFGVEPPWHYWWHYVDRRFGQHVNMRCPYYIDREGGLCGIWRYRNSRCSTWFCKFERGVFGLNFWTKISQLLFTIEKGLADWCILKLELKLPEQPADRTETVWGNWSGREREFYKRCYDLVAILSGPEALNHAGIQIDLMESVLKTFHEIQSSSLPEKLQPGKFTSEDLANGFVRVRGGCAYDTVDLTQEQFQMLKSSEAFQANTFERSMFQKLYDLQILVAVDPRAD